MAELTYDDFKNRINIQDLLVEDVYKRQILSLLCLMVIVHLNTILCESSFCYKISI